MLECFSLYFCYENYFGSYKVNITYIRETLSFNLPLVPYYISTILNNNADRILIQKLGSFEDAAVFSVARSFSMIVFIISGALNLSLQTWMYRNLRDKKYRNETLLLNSTYIVSIVCILLIILIPEIINIMASNKYIAALDYMAPLILSVYLMFIYQQAINLILFYGYTKIVMKISCSFTLVSILMDYLLIREYGYTVCAYICFLGCILTTLITTYLMQKICILNNINLNKMFFPKEQIYLFLATFSMITIVQVSTYNAYIRLLFLAVLAWFVYKNKELITIR